MTGLIYRYAVGSSSGEGCWRIEVAEAEEGVEGDLDWVAGGGGVSTMNAEDGG